MADEPTPATTVIGPDSSVNGELKGEERIVIYGRANGQIDTTTELVVESGAVIEAEVNASKVVIRGTVNGNIACSDHAVIGVGGVVNGDIRAPRVSLAIGGRISGYIDTGVQRQEVIDAILEHLSEDSPALQLTGQPKWGHAKSAFKK